MISSSSIVIRRELTVCETIVMNNPLLEFPIQTPTFSEVFKIRFRSRVIMMKTFVSLPWSVGHFQSSHAQNGCVLPYPNFLGIRRLFYVPRFSAQISVCNLQTNSGCPPKMQCVVDLPCPRAISERLPSRLSVLRRLLP